MSIQRGENVLHQAKAASGKAAPGDADPITTEVIRYGLEAAADQMRVALKRTAFSPIIYEMTDFAAALYDRDVRLLAQAQALPAFLGTLGYCIEAALAHNGGPEALQPGDVIFSTYAYDIGSHQQDATLVAPGFLEGGLVGYAVVKAHHLDLGAKDPYCTDTIDVFQEGAIFPSVKLYRGGELQEEMYRTIVANSRQPQALAGDLKAQVGAARVGLDGLLDVIRRFGLTDFSQAVERMFDHGEATVRKVLASIPDGRYAVHHALDNNGVEPDRVPFELEVRVEDDEVTVDLTSAPPEQRGPMNTPVASTISGVRLAITALAGCDQSANEGHFRPIKVLTRPGSLYHPRPPTPVFLYGWPVQALVDLIHKALSGALPDAIPAGSGGDLCCLILWGQAHDGSSWIDGLDHAVGQGATRRADSLNPLMHFSCSGITSRPVEVLERRLPIVVQRLELAADSGGGGCYRGGPGIDISYRFERDAFATFSIERTTTAPWGLQGGNEGRANRCLVRFPDGTVAEYGKATAVPIPAGSIIELHTGGGGGYGSPSKRNATAVSDDVVDGYVTKAAALRTYPHATNHLAEISTSDLTTTGVSQNAEAGP